MADLFDDALERLHGTGTEVAGGGDPNHGPMVLEALTALGRQDVALAWVDRYRRRLAVLPAETTSPIMAAAWPSALGRVDRIADWVAFFREELARDPWSMALRTWLPRLLRGAITAGMHALLRTAHIARALERCETPPRLDELATALGYWAACYRQPPGPARLSGGLAPEVALERIPRIARARLTDGMPREVVFAVSEHPDFLAAVEAAHAPSSVGVGLSALTDLGARAYLANAASNPLVLLHTVTGPAALRLLLPYLDAKSQQDAFAAVYRCSAAWIAAYAGEIALVASPEAAPVSLAEIVERCVDTEDPHAIKLVEACLREDRLEPRPSYLAAALDWATRLRESRSWTPAQRGAAGIGFA